MRYLPILLVAGMLSAPPAAFALDPVSLIVLRLLRDQLITSGLEAGLETRNGDAASPPAAQRPRNLKSWVEEGFPYLDRRQREAVYEQLVAIMQDPDNAGQRDRLLGEFVRAAAASRQTHDALSRLTYAQKRAVAAEAAASYRGKSAEELQQAIEALRSSAMPLPSDLRELMLAEFTAGDRSADSR